MRVAGEQLPDGHVRHAVQVEPPGVLFDVGMKDDLHQHVAKLLAEMLRVFLIDRLGRLVCFLQQIPADARVSLFGVPGTAAGARRIETSFFRSETS